PKAGYLAAIAEVGADIGYIVTGRNANQSLNSDFACEFDLVNVYDVSVSAGDGAVCLGEPEPASRLAFRKDWLSRHGLYAKDLVI
ncbi:peptidase S24, partial [Acinetobacter baumannii]|nr:peptidase S24 [Acinetobacter baumannii]